MVSQRSAVFDLGIHLQLARPGTTKVEPVLREDQHSARFHALPVHTRYAPMRARTFAQTG